MKKFGLMLALLVAVILAAPAFAQEQTGGITGSVKDDSGAFAKGMPGTTPQAIDVYIMDYARKLKLETEAHEKARIELENQLRYLEGLSPQHAEQVAKVRADPAFENVLKKPGS